jgi:hypothetical protein
MHLRQKYPKEKPISPQKSSSVSSSTQKKIAIRNKHDDEVCLLPYKILGPRDVGFGSFSKCFRYVLSVVTPRYRRWKPILVSLRCFEDRPPEDVSLCEVLRCIRGD